MRAKSQTAPVWDFLRIAYETRDNLEAGVLDAAECGPWIEERHRDGDQVREFSINWNQVDSQICDGLDGLIEAINSMIYDAIYDADFRRCISGVFYRRVLADLDGRIRCGDRVDAPVLAAKFAANQAATTPHFKLEGRGFEKMKRRYDRYIRLANRAYDAACDNCRQFGWEKNVEKFIERDASDVVAVIGADFEEWMPEALRGFHVLIDDEVSRFATYEEANAYARSHADTVYKKSSVDDYFADCERIAA